MLKIISKFVKSLLILLTILTISIVSFLAFTPVFGGKPDVSSQEKINSSKNFDGERFVNLVPTQVRTPNPNDDYSALDFFRSPKGKNPSEALPNRVFNKEIFDNGDFVWLGHSTILTKTNDVTILTDPIFNSASPVQFAVKPFAMQTVNSIDSMPEIDVIIISHDHYDHLDYLAIKDLASRTKKFLVPLGIKAHLLRWGISAEKIEEMDWYESTTYKTVKFTLTPSRHFSGRNVNNAFSTLWGSWVVQSSALNIFFSGDSGYFDEFKKIGEVYGPFDIAFIENGAYNTNWAQIHMLPEQSVQASIDLKAKLFFPIHWGKFDLSLHPWKEPIERASKAAQEKQVNIVTPIVGEVFVTTRYPKEKWWEKVN